MDISAMPSPSAELIGYLSEESLEKLHDPEWRARRNVSTPIWAANNPPSRAVVPVYLHPASPQPSAEPTDYAALELEHFGDPDKRTGIYHPDNCKPPHEFAAKTKLSAALKQSLPTAPASSREAFEPVTEFDHPDLVGGIKWSRLELDWINARIKAALASQPLAVNPVAVEWQCRHKEKSPKYSMFWQPCGEHAVEQLKCDGYETRALGIIRDPVEVPGDLLARIDEAKDLALNDGVIYKTLIECRRIIAALTRSGK
jgi:hypothetical protein